MLVYWLKSVCLLVNILTGISIICGWRWFPKNRFKEKTRGRTPQNQITVVVKKMSTGWWFGTFCIFPYIGNNHPNWLSYFSEGFKPPTSQKNRGSVLVMIPSILPILIRREDHSTPCLPTAWINRRLAAGESPIKWEKTMENHPFHG